MAKIKDVARLAGVSPSTVSLVLNNKGYVSDITRAKVQAAVAELNYVPSEVGRNLSLNRTNIIGVIIPDIAHPFFAALMHEIEIALYRYGYKTMVCSTSEKENAEPIFLDMLRRHSMDGLIIGAHALHLDKYDACDLPIVAFDRYISDSIPIVQADHRQGGIMAAKAILARHPKHVVQITGHTSVNTPAHEREDVFTNYIKQAGVQIDEVVMSANALRPEDFARAAHRAFTSYPDIDAIFCTDLGAVAALQEAFLRHRPVPEDMAIIAYDGTYLTRLSPLILTAIVQPMAKLGQKAADTMLAVIQNRPLPDLTPLPMEFQKGGTC